MKRIIIMALGILLALALATPMVLAQVEQGADASGTAGELAAAWAQWAYSKPVDEDSPLIGGDPNYSEARCDGTPVSPTQGNTWFLAGTSDASKVKRTCTMPAETTLFFPVVSSLAFPFLPDETAEGERQKAIASIDDIENDPKFTMLVTVDGKKVESDQIVRAVSPPFFTLTLPEENVFDPFIEVPAGEYEGASVDGLWVTLPPLPAGNHKIRFEMNSPKVGFSQDNTYKLRVVN